MMPKRETPLLPVHSMRHPQKRSRRKGTCMRLVIMAAVLFCIGYAVFATRFIGPSKERRTAQDTFIRTQLEESRRANIAAANDAVQNGGRNLKADTAPSPHPNRHYHATHRHVERPQPRRRLEVSPDSLSGSDADLYDEVVSADTSNHGEHAYHGAIHVDSEVRPAPETKASPHPGARDELPVTAPHIATNVGQQIHNENPHGQQAQPQPQAVRVQDFHLSSTGGSNGSGRAVLAGAGEADREAEAKRGAAITAPSLAVGSRIEVDSHAGASPLLEPGASPVVQTAKEPSSERLAHANAPITVAHLEPDSHQAQQGPEQHAPILAQAPRETDSSSTTGVQHRAPDETTSYKSGAQGGGVTAAPLMAHGSGSSATAVPAQSIQESPVVHAPSPGSDLAPQRNPLAKGLYAMEAVDIDGKTRSLSEFAGKVTVVVNVASACGYTDENYKGLMKTYEKYRPHGLEILGFPCNQFGSQESGTDAEIKSFCSAHYHVTFPMFSKVDVNGPHTHPVYQFLKRELPVTEGGGGGTGPGQDLVWNFQKIIVNHEGKPVKRIYQAWDQGAVEQEVYRLLHEARRVGSGATASS